MMLPCLLRLWLLRWGQYCLPSSVTCSGACAQLFSCCRGGAWAAVVGFLLLLLLWLLLPVAGCLLLLLLWLLLRVAGMRR